MYFEWYVSTVLFILNSSSACILFNKFYHRNQNNSYNLNSSANSSEIKGKNNPFYQSIDQGLWDYNEELKVEGDNEYVVSTTK